MVVKRFQYEGDRPIGNLSDDIKDALRSAGIELGINSLTRVKGSENTNVRMKTENYGWMVRVQSNSQEAVNAVASVLGEKTEGVESHEEEAEEAELPERLQDNEEEQDDDIDEPISDDDDYAARVTIYDNGDYHIDYGGETEHGILGVSIVGDESNTELMATGDDFDWTEKEIQEFSKRIADELKEMKNK